MSAILHPIGMLKQYTHGLKDIVIQADRTVNEVLNDLKIPGQLVALILANQTAVNKEYVVRDGDYIEIMAVIGGG